MKADILEQEMKNMWKEIFHDSDDYINLIFDCYFNPKHTVYREQNGKLIAMMLCVPYEFECISDDIEKISKGEEIGQKIKYDSTVNNTRIIRGLYLCGLATAVEHRGNGLMTDMLEEANKKAYEEGFDFTFLIPASDSLKLYYKDRRYEICSYRLKELYTKNHIFLSEFDSDNCDSRKDGNGVFVYKSFSRVNEELIARLYNFYLRMNENNDTSKAFSIVHNRQDFVAVIKENFISGGELHVKKSEVGNLNIECDSGVISGFAVVNLNEDSECIIPHIFCDNNDTKNHLLQSIKESHPKRGIVFYDYPDNCDDVIIKSTTFVGDSMSISGDIRWGRDVLSLRASQAESYAMGRILNPCEILKFMHNKSNDSKYSILVKSDFDAKSWNILADKNTFEVEEKSNLLSDTTDSMPSRLSHRPSSRSSNGLCSHIRSRKNPCSMEYEDVPMDIDLTTKATELTLQELASIIWRPRGAEDYAGMAFGIPRIPFNLCFMLD